ncbi:MAG: hypothetical protein AB1489_29260 [Acidobacteriota bacterium]
MSKTVHLAPTSTGDIIDRAVRIYRNNFAPLLAIVAIPGLITYIGTLMASFGASTMSEAAEVGIALGILMIIAGYFLIVGVGPIIHLIVVGGLSRTLADHIMMGKRVSLAATWQAIRSNFWKLLGGQILVMVIVGFISGMLVMLLYFLIIIGVVATVTLHLPNWLIITLAIVITVPLIVGVMILFGAVYARTVFVPCAIMIEGQSIGDAISRSMKLGNNNWWRVLLIILFDFAIAFSFIAALGIPLSVYGFFSGALSDIANIPGWVPIAYSTVDQMGKMLTVPISTIAYTLLYFDSRVRKEGYDVELLAWQIGPAVQTPVQQSASATVIPESPPIITEVQATPTITDEVLLTPQPNESVDIFSPSLEVIDKVTDEATNEVQATAKPIDS